ncbi:fibronectin type III domain-containing protein [Salinispora vitiensis]|uniref:fibronectin type III domain-containing protein n=1 Tax=Salinispora vitiensis TaxID=999544 RepID=UPI00037D36F6|nr:tetratricopeptide repeat protein [Salinispora vitiensis]
MAAVQHRALALRHAGDLAGARQLLTDAVESAHPPPYGPDHPEVLDTAHLLARLHREAGDPSAARRVLEEALAAGERLRSDADPLLLALVFELASVADELGNRHEARRNFHRILNAGPDALGADHSSVRAARAYFNEGLADSSSGTPSPPSPEQPNPGRPGTGAVAAPSSNVRRAQPPVPPQAAPAPSNPSPGHADRPAPHPPAVGPRPDGDGDRRRLEQSWGPQSTYGSFGARPAPGVPATDPAPGPSRMVDDTVVGLVPAAHPAREPQRRDRNWTVVATVLAAAGVAAVAIVGTGLVVLLRSDPTAAPLPETPRASAAETPSGVPSAPPPTDLSLRDDRSSVTLTWTDPSDGTVPFVVAAGQAGQQLGMNGRVEPGRTSYTINGLSAGVDYCFTVLAVYSTETFTTSGQVCTNRER